jgi:hypothetical protein
VIAFLRRALNERAKPLGTNDLRAKDGKVLQVLKR